MIVTSIRAAFLAALLLLPCAADAALFRAYIASFGSDANTCTLPAPCRLLPAALAAVAEGGEIWMLDSANFNTGPVNVDKSVSILAVPGAVGSVVALGGHGIVVATAGVKLVLRNVVIAPFAGGGGLNGINMTAGSALTLEGCLVANLPQSGIVVAGGSSVRITDTTVRDNGSHGLLLQDGVRATLTRVTLSGNGGDGLRVLAAAASTATTADVGASTIDANGNGLAAVSLDSSAVARLSVRDSRVVRNGGTGIGASSGGAEVSLSVSSTILSNNATGVTVSGTGARAWAAYNTVSGNGTGFANSGGVFETAGTNAVRNNGTPTSGPIGSVAPL